MNAFNKLLAAFCLTLASSLAWAAEGEEKMKYFLMIAEPKGSAWAGVIQDGGDMAGPAGEAIEAMGGKLLSYYIGVSESKNYGVVAFPDSYDTAKIIYLRAAQDLMKSMEFVEIIPSDQAVGMFEDVKGMLNAK